jgi:2-dehydropantoate 2-reductase
MGAAGHVTVWGAGAIGGITGAALARAGRDVLLVDVNTEHVAVMQRGGLHVEDARGDWHVLVRAATPGEIREPLEVVLLTVKAQATPDALVQIAPHLTDRSVVVSLQNGLNEEMIAERIGADRTVGCLVNWSADWIAPGRVQFGGAGSFLLGELDGAMTPRLADLADLLQAVMPTRTTGNIWGYLWAKTCYAALLFATALTDATIYEVVEGPYPIQRTLVRLVAESMAVAETVGVRLEAFDEYDPAVYRRGAAGDRSAVLEAMAATSRFYRGLTKVKSGIWRDLAVRRRKTEVEAQIGVVAAKGGRLGVPTPLTERLIAMIHDLEDGRRPMGRENLDELAAMV